MARNTSFQFKQFTIRQDRSAMKVCTDACVLGAWADIKGAHRIVDIGSGTGLLSLMVAQRNVFAAIDAVEIDADAFYQSGENVEQSPFRDRIRIFHEAIQDFEPEYLYDVAVTNPPFFQSDLLSPSEKKNLAHHAGALGFDALLKAIERLLKPAGQFNILLPVDEGNLFSEKAVQSGWFLNKKLTLFHNPSKKPFRQLMVFSKVKSADNVNVEEVLHIYEEDGFTYDPAFRTLLKDFYLKF